MNVRTDRQHTELMYIYVGLLRRAPKIAHIASCFMVVPI